MEILEIQNHKMRRQRFEFLLFMSSCNCHTRTSGTQSGKVFRLRGKGIPRLRRNGRGDQLVVIQVTVPTRLTDEQKRLFQLLSKTLGKEVIPQTEKGVFEKLRDALGDAFGV